MAKTRSPSYPAISLKEAIDKVSLIYNQNYQAPVSRAVAAELMGYGGLNGKSLGVLSSLLKYGLLEGRGDDTRVSDLALSIIAHEPGTAERAEAVRIAASKPDLFAEIDQRYSSGKASDAAIRSYLLTQKFIPIAADAVVRSYRETKSLVDAEALEYSGAEEQMPNVERNLSSLIDQPKGHHHDLMSANRSEMIDDDPYEISIAGNSKTGKTISGRFAFRDQQSVDDLIGLLQAMKAQLPKAAPSSDIPQETSGGLAS